MSFQGLWLRLEDAEVFFYATSRISPDQRFQIEERSRLQIVNSSSSSELLIYSLIIDEVRSQDQGTYSCQADNRIIKLFILNLVGEWCSFLFFSSRSNFSFVFEERPSFVTDEYNILYRTKIGTNLSIACQSQGKPSPSIRWTKKIDGKEPISSSSFESDRRLVSETSRIPLIACSAPTTACPLTFTDVNRWHYGTYECVATNIAGTISRFYEVDVQCKIDEDERKRKKEMFVCWLVPPVVSSPSMRFSHSIGDSVTLDCWIDGNPSPDIRWFHRFSNSISEEIDLSRQFSSNSPLQTDHWFIKQEQFNATRWKTSLFIQVNTLFRRHRRGMFSFSIFLFICWTRSFFVERRIVTVMLNIPFESFKHPSHHRRRRRRRRIEWKSLLQSLFVSLRIEQKCNHRWVVIFAVLSLCFSFSAHVHWPVLSFRPLIPTNKSLTHAHEFILD